MWSTPSDAGMDVGVNDGVTVTIGVSDPGVGVAAPGVVGPVWVGVCANAGVALGRALRDGSAPGVRVVLSCATVGNGPGVAGPQSSSSPQPTQTSNATLIPNRVHALRCMRWGPPALNSRLALRLRVCRSAPPGRNTGRRGRGSCTFLPAPAHPARLCE